MIVLVKMVWKCLTSPRLYKIYQDGPMDVMYEPQGVEKWCGRIVTTANILLTITLYTSPFISLYVYKRGFLSTDECISLMRLFGGIGSFVAVAFLLRAYGRATNPKYVEFLKVLDRIPHQKPNEYMDQIRKYDFDFSKWPTTYAMPPAARSSWWSTNPFQSCASEELPYYKRVSLQLLAFIATHTFALRLIYPGSLSLIYNILWTPLFLGRTNLVEIHNGQRAKVKTADGNEIDTMFVDNRWSNINGETLVVCCEGNSGFYEIGIMTTPIKAGYSTLGWNHPGFAESTGLPYPSQEHHAIDAIMQYAINVLNFKAENIVMFGWSIGGYSAAWAAAHYPVKAVVLDATFDDLLPLAQNQMPESWAPLVKEVVRSHVNLHVAEQLKNYSGPVHLVRRTEDEIICLTPGKYGTNRGNYLLLEIIRQRHPSLIDDHLSLFVRYATMLGSRRPSLHSELPPEDALVLRHVEMYSRDYKSTHCTPLPKEIFVSIMNQILGRNR